MQENMKLFDYKLRKLEKPDIIQSTDHCVTTEQLRNEINYKDSQIEELKSKMERSDEEHFNKYSKHTLYSRLQRIEEENSRLNKINEKLLNENSQLKKSLKLLEDENNLQTIRYNDLEREKKENGKKKWSGELELKSLKKEYDMVVLKVNSLTKQMNSLNSKVEDLKAENETINKENSLLKQKLNKNSKIPGTNLSSISTTIQGGITYNNTRNDIDNSSINFSVYKKLKLPIENQKNKIEEDVYYPSEKKLKDAKNEILYLEDKLSSLIYNKKLTENELFKQGEKSRTILEINKKRRLEENLQETENQINEIKTRMRQLNLNK